VTYPRRALRQSMAWIHGWLGLLAGWILFAMFLTGTASYFRPEITRWMQPELSGRNAPPARAAAAAARYLSAAGKDDVQWFVTLPDARSPVTHAYVQPKPDPAAAPRRRAPELLLDPVTGTPVTARDTRGGEHFYRFHFQLQLPVLWGRWLAGLCGLFMLAAIVSGVVTHKRIFADFFTLRWNKGQRSWLDAHNASAVLALPFHAMITWTGLMTLVLMYMPWPITANYANPTTFTEQAYDFGGEDAASGRPAPLADMGALVRDAERRFGGPAGRMVVRHPGDAAATVAVYRGAGRSINARGPSVTYSGVTGRVLSQTGTGGPALATAGVLLGLHVAQFADGPLRVVFFLMGLTGAAMVGTGLLLWTTARRRPGAAPFFGLKLVERLNIGAVAGLPVGMGAFLLSNRLIPAAAEGRAATEVSAMFWTWGAVALAQLALAPRRAWAATFRAGALVFAAVPVADALFTDRGLPGSLTHGDALFATFDLSMLAVAALLAFAAARAGRAPAPARRRARAAELAHA